MDIARDGKSLVLALAPAVRNLVRPDRGEHVAVLLSLGGRLGSPMLASTLQDKGFEVHVVSRRVPGNELRYCARWHRMDCLADGDDIVRLVESLKPVGVFSESRNVLLPLKNRLLEHLQLRSLGADATHTSNSKIAFRNAIDARGLKNVPWQVYRPAEPVEIAFPLLLKPDLGTGSKGVHLVVDPAQLDALQGQSAREQGNELFGGTRVLEGFVAGRQFDVEGVARDGDLYPLSVTEECYEVTRDAVAVRWHLLGPPLEPSLLQRLKGFACEVVSAAGVRNGAWHCEVRLDREDVLYPIDYSNRMGYPRMVSESSGVDFIGKYVESLFAAKFEPPEPTVRPVFQCYIEDAAERKAFEALAKAAPANVIEFRKTRSYRSTLTRYGRISLRADSYAELASLLGEFGVLPPQWIDLYDPV